MICVLSCNYLRPLMSHSFSSAIQNPEANSSGQVRPIWIGSHLLSTIPFFGHLSALPSLLQIGPRRNVLPEPMAQAEQWGDGVLQELASNTAKCLIILLYIHLNILELLLLCALTNIFDRFTTTNTGLVIMKKSLSNLFDISTWQYNF